MERIVISDFSAEAASRKRGLMLKEKLEESMSEGRSVVVDFSGITRFASPFFNNSFAALAIAYGFPKIEAIGIENISETGRQTYEASLENARDIYENDEMSQKIKEIVSHSPKKVGV